MVAEQKWQRLWNLSESPRQPVFVAPLVFSLSQSICCAAEAGIEKRSGHGPEKQLTRQDGERRREQGWGGSGCGSLQVLFGMIDTDLKLVCFLETQIVY